MLQLNEEENIIISLLLRYPDPIFHRRTYPVSGAGQKVDPAKPLPEHYDSDQESRTRTHSRRSFPSKRLQ